MKTTRPKKENEGGSCLGVIKPLLEWMIIIFGPGIGGALIGLNIILNSPDDSLLPKAIIGSLGIAWTGTFIWFAERAERSNKKELKEKTAPKK